MPSARISIIVLLGVAVLVVAGSALAPHDPLRAGPDAHAPGPERRALLGTDYLGRDVLSRLMAGTRISVAGALEAVVVAAVLGILPGLASAWLGPAVRVGRAAGHRHPDGAAVHGVRDRGRRHPRQRPAPVDGRRSAS